MTFMADGRTGMTTRERKSTGTNTGRTMTRMTYMFLNLIMVAMRGFLAKLLAGRIERSSEVLAGNLHRSSSAFTWNGHSERTGRTSPSMTRK